MDYTETRPHEGKAQIILQEIRGQLTLQGFRIERQDEDGFSMKGPGMRNTEQSAQRGMSRVEVRVTSNDVTLRADLGGVRSMCWFITLFPIVLGAAMSVLFVGLSITRPWWPLVVVAPWLALGPSMGMIIKRRTFREIDTLLHNAIAVGEIVAEAKPPVPVPTDSPTDNVASPPEQVGCQETDDGWKI